MSREDSQRLRVAVTGGTSGLGLALVRELSRRGARVALIARHRDAVERVAREQPGATGIVGDVSRKEDVHPIAIQVLGALGGLDALVNNASSLGPVPLVPLADPTARPWSSRSRPTSSDPSPDQGVLARLPRRRGLDAARWWSTCRATPPSPRTPRGALCAARRRFIISAGLERELAPKGSASVDRSGDRIRRCTRWAVPGADRSTLKSPHAQRWRLPI